jgi:tRNA(fMet)-specific endonuclease VapC
VNGFRYLLDTNVFIDAAKRREPVVRRFSALRRGEAAQSVITYGELLYGARKSNRESKARQRINDAATFLQLTPDVAETYGLIRAALERQGRVIGSNDLWIAAHAIAAGLVLVTNNEREFRRVPGLNVENWAEPSTKP